MLKAAVFDLDGTITVLSLPLDAMRSDTKNYLFSKGLPEYILDPEDGVTSSMMKGRDYFLSHGKTMEEWRRMEQEIETLLSRHETSAAKDVCLINGSLEAVARIRAHGLKTAILTNNGRHAVEIILQKIPLERYFDVVQTRNESPNPKPYPDGLLNVIRRLNVRIDEAVYVGDARIDLAAASRAGIEFIGVATGETSRAALLNAGAQLAFESLDDVADELIRRISRPHS